MRVVYTNLREIPPPPVRAEYSSNSNALDISNASIFSNRGCQHVIQRQQVFNPFPNLLDNVVRDKQQAAQESQIRLQRRQIPHRRYQAILEKLGYSCLEVINLYSRRIGSRSQDTF